MKDSPNRLTCSGTGSVYYSESRLYYTTWALSIPVLWGEAAGFLWKRRSYGIIANPYCDSERV